MNGEEKGLSLSPKERGMSKGKVDINAKKWGALDSEKRLVGKGKWGLGDRKKKLSHPHRREGGEREKFTQSQGNKKITLTGKNKRVTS